MAATNSTSKSATDEAIEWVCAKHLHQCLWLPERSSHGRLRVTYSTTSNFSDTKLPAVLFCGPMFGGRWVGSHMNHLAKSLGLRVICPDRPGMGGSTRVPLNIRMQVWLEMVPALLKELAVEHVSLVCHSAGTMYTLNTMFHLRDILDPRAPYVGLIAPWVHNDHSELMLWNMASKLPNGLFDGWNNINKFIAQNVAPAVSWSGGLISSAAGLFQAEPGNADIDSTTPAEKYGTSEEIAKQIEKMSGKYYFAEDTTAANEEARLCLKKSGSGPFWDACEDYEIFVTNLREKEQERKLSDSSQPKLRVQVFFAESDMMIGKGGQKYFEQCWRQDGVSDNIEFESKELSGTNHDTAILDLKKGALRTIFEEIEKSSQSSS